MPQLVYLLFKRELVMKTILKNSINLLSKIKYLFLLFFLSLNLFALYTVAHTESRYFFTLDNGMKVYLLSNSQVSKTKVTVQVNVGTNMETVENAGISHLLEHLIFRDERVPKNKYVYYLHQEGASYVYGFTSQNLTEYLATIESKKSYWLVKTFAKMIFDKKINETDLEVERSALQVEIGNIKWYHAPINNIISFIDWVSGLFPSAADIYYAVFSLEREEPSPIEFNFIQNNKKFTLEQLMQHYDNYYYPSNMVLKVVGNFNELKMKETINNTFGTVKKIGEREQIAYQIPTDKNFKTASSD